MKTKPTKLRLALELVAWLFPRRAVGHLALCWFFIMVAGWMLTISDGFFRAALFGAIIYIMTFPRPR
jgi:hypothetical protein